MTAPQTTDNSAVRGVSQQTSGRAHHPLVGRMLFWLVGVLAGSCLALGAGALVVGVAHGLARWTMLPATEIAVAGVLLVCLFALATIAWRFLRELTELRRTVRHSASYLCEILDRMTWIEGVLEQTQEPDRVSHEAVNRR